MRKAVLRVALLSALLTFAVASAAWAHVEISPESAQPGSTETFTAAVPTEKSIPTTEVRLEIPEGFAVTGVRSPAGWRGQIENNSIAWSGGEIGEDEVREFSFEARVPNEGGTFAWNAIQTYQGGSVVEWTGAPDSEEPAPVIEVSGSGEAGGSHAHGVDDSHHGEGLHEGENLPDSGGIGLTVLGLVAAVCVAAGVSVLAMRRRG